MTDKVQKIKDWISCQQDSLIDANGNFQHSEDEAVYHTLCNLDAYIDFLQEELVTEDLEKVEKEWLTPQLDKSYADYGEAKMMELTRFDGYAMLDAIEFGAKWQKEKDDEEKVLTYKHGFEDCKEQMMSKAIDGVVHHFEKCKVASVHYNDPTGVPMVYFTSTEGLSAGDKVKIIAIKED